MREPFAHFISVGESLSEVSDMGFTTVLVLAAAAVGLIFYWFKKSFAYWEKRGFVFVPPSIPFGSLKGVGYEVHFSEKTRGFYEAYKNKTKALGLYFFVNPAVLITNLDIIRHVLVSDFKNFHDRGVYYHAEADPLSVSLVFQTKSFYSDFSLYHLRLTYLHLRVSEHNLIFVLMNSSQKL